MLFKGDKSKQRYRLESGVTCIDIRLTRGAQLFDMRDPAPFPERDLNDDAVNYLLGSLTELRKAPRVKLVIHIAERDQFSVQPESIRRAIQSYFEYESVLITRELKQTFRQGYIALMIGLVFLFSAIYISHEIGTKSISLWSSMIQEGFSVMGWVAMWRPLDIMLYSWWPIVARKNVVQRLISLPVEVLYDNQ